METETSAYEVLRNDREVLVLSAEPRAEAYHGYLPADPELCMDPDHHHGRVRHMHSHEGPHTHDAAGRAVRIELPVGTTGLDEGLRWKLLIASGAYAIRKIEQEQGIEVQDTVDFSQAVFASLKAAGTPEHWYLTRTDDVDKAIVGGPYDTWQEAFEDSVNVDVPQDDLSVSEGYNVNGKVLQG